MVQSPFNVEYPHVEAHYNSRTETWSTPVVVTDSFPRIHPLATCISFGQQCFEGLKAFRGPDGTMRIFRPSAHAARLNHSAAFVSMPCVPGELFMEAARLATAHNAHTIPSTGGQLALYLRPFLMGTSPQFIPIPSDTYVFYIFVTPLAQYLGDKPFDVLVEETFDHAAPKGVGSAKLGSNYGPLMRHDAAAKQQGFQTTLHLDALTHTKVEEFATSGFIGITTNHDGTTKVTVSDSDCVIQSITTDSFVQVARHLGWTVEKRPIEYAELSSFDEVIAAGTAASVCAVRTIFRKSTGEDFRYLKSDQDIGTAAAQVKAIMTGVQQGKVDDVFGWMIEVDSEQGSALYADEARLWS